MNARNRDKKVFDLLMEIDRLEELREDLDGLGLRSIDDIERRIEEINAMVEELDDNGERPA